jgi:predicted nucleic acid-binding protein
VTTYLLDTNIILRFSNPSDGQHELVTNAVAAILREGDECYLASQVLIEMWVVATRPTDVNGLGWSTTYTRNIIDQLMQRFPMVEEVPQLFLTWLDIVSTYKILGKRTHDARIAALMISSAISHILTLNPGDFSNIPDISVVHPQNIVSRN